MVAKKSVINSVDSNMKAFPMFLTNGKYHIYLIVKLSGKTGDKMPNECNKLQEEVNWLYEWEKWLFNSLCECLRQ